MRTLYSYTDFSLAYYFHINLYPWLGFLQEFTEPKGKVSKPYFILCAFLSTPIQHSSGSELSSENNLFITRRTATISNLYKKSNFMIMLVLILYSYFQSCRSLSVKHNTKLNKNITQGNYISSMRESI